MSGWWMASYVVLWLLVVVLCATVVALARQIGTLHLRLGPRGALELDDEGPALGDLLPASEVTTLDGREVSVGGPGTAQLVMFASPGCMVCKDVLPSLTVVSRSTHLDPILVSDGGTDETRRTFGRYDVPVVAGESLMQRYLIPGTPYVILTDEAGIVRAKGTVNNLEQVEGLIDTAARRGADARHRTGVA